jgi:hypothetical protein
MRFKPGDTIKSNRSGSVALVIDRDLYNQTYTLKYEDNKWGGNFVYSLEAIEAYWNLVEEEKKISTKSCTCGVWTTYGKNVSLRIHSSYCDLIRDNKRGI